ncbi:MAG: SDR family oxidoreductase [Actinomycetota bacterium]
MNLTSALVASQRFAQRAERGKIINIVSEYATFGGPNLVSYSASKHGLEGLTKTLAIDLAPNFQVNAIQPGWTATPMTEAVQNFPEMNDEVLRRTPHGRWGLPSDHGGAAVFLASSASEFVTDVTIPVDGGLSDQITRRHGWTSRAPKRRGWVTARSSSEPRKGRSSSSIRG